LVHGLHKGDNKDNKDDNNNNNDMMIIIIIIIIIIGDRNVIQKEAEKILKYKDLTVEILRK
jgi:hypothetical protein